MRVPRGALLLGAILLCGPVPVVAAPVATPVIGPAAGIYATARSVTITCSTPGATIRYTTDGSRPTAASPAYAGAFSVPATAVVRAIATAPGFTESLPARAFYVIESGGTLIGPDHTQRLDGSSRLLSWLPQDIAYAEVINRIWANFLTAMPTSGGNPYWYLYSYMGPNLSAATGWPSAPGGQMAMLADGAIQSFPYTGNVAVMTAVMAGLQFHLAHGQTPMTGAWQGVPYNEANPGSTTYNGGNYSGNGWSPGVGDGTGNLEPDKVAEMGLAYLWFYMYDPTRTAFRDAAIRCADALASNRVTATSRQVSPWPFRVRQADGAVPTTGAGEKFCGNFGPAIRLFDSLIRLGLGSTATYTTARNAVWTWATSFPIPNNDWANYFEDQPWSTSFGENQNQLNPGNFGRLILEQPTLIANASSVAAGLATWIKGNFGQAGPGGAEIVNEQFWYMHPMCSHTSRYGMLNALLYRATGTATYKEEAYRSLNWATYMNRADGWTLDGYPLPNQIWFTDGFGDTVRNLAVAMYAVPEFAPPGEDHLLGSTSVVQTVAYGKDAVSYTTFDAAAQETLRLSFTPGGVTGDGAPLAQRADLAAEGWTWDAALGVLRIRHDAATQIVVASGAPPPVISPGTASAPPRGTVAFSASGGSGTGYGWSLLTNASGGSIGASTGAYLAGPTGSVTDVVEVADSLGATATRNVTVTAGVTIAPATASAAPGGSVSFSASGGSGAGYAWSLLTNASGGSIGASTGAYLAGPTGSVTDVVRVVDSLGNAATRNVTVTAATGSPTISPAAATAPPRGSVAFSASGGSGTGYVWSLPTNASGGSIGASTGAYLAGPTGSVTDVVRVVDSLGTAATRNVTVTAGVTIAPATASAAPGGSVSFSASGGSGAGYAWSLLTNASGGSIGASTGAYLAGPTGSVTDVVRVVDSLGNAATRNVTVTAATGSPTISPAAATAPPRGSVAFSASGGSGTGYVWSLLTNASGGSIGASTGAYLAGPSGNVTDVVRVVDSMGGEASAVVTVRSPASSTSALRAGCGCAAGSPGLEALAGPLLLAVLRRRRRAAPTT